MCRCNYDVMIRTQIQLPDRLYRALKHLAQLEETSLAEIVRRAGEYIIAVHPDVDKALSEWEPPKPRKLGIRKSIRESEWRRLANERPVEDLLPDRKPKA